MSAKKTLQERLTEDRRLVVLRLLQEMPANRSNSSVIADSLNLWGHHVSRDYVRTQLRWLEEQGLVSIEDLDGVLVVTLTERGHDVATGAAVVDGVKKPRG
jgi:repressor of nif and glnA expression